MLRVDFCRLVNYLESSEFYNSLAVDAAKFLRSEVTISNFTLLLIMSLAAFGSGGLFIYIITALAASLRSVPVMLSRRLKRERQGIYTPQCGSRSAYVHDPVAVDIFKASLPYRTTPPNAAVVEGVRIEPLCSTSRIADDELVWPGLPVKFSLTVDEPTCSLQSCLLESSFTPLTAQGIVDTMDLSYCRSVVTCWGELFLGRRKRERHVFGTVGVALDEYLVHSNSSLNPSLLTFVSREAVLAAKHYLCSHLGCSHTFADLDSLLQSVKSIPYRSRRKPAAWWRYLDSLSFESYTPQSGEAVEELPEPVPEGTEESGDDSLTNDKASDAFAKSPGLVAANAAANLAHTCATATQSMSSCPYEVARPDGRLTMVTAGSMPQRPAATASLGKQDKPEVKYKFVNKGTRYERRVRDSY